MDNMGRMDSNVSLSPVSPLPRRSVVTNNPWSGYTQGLAALDHTFDSLEQNRMREHEMARQAKIDALNEPYLKIRNELAGKELSEKERIIANLRDYDEAWRKLERNPGTVPIMTDKDNPAYVPPQTITPLSAIKERYQQGSASMDVGEGATSDMTKELGGILPSARTEAQGLPTMQVAGERPLNKREMDQKRIQLALNHGQFNALKSLVDIQTHDDERVTKMTKTIAETYQKFGYDWTKTSATLKMMAQQVGMDPSIVDSMSPFMGPGGSPFIQYPISNTGSVGVVGPDGKSHIVTPSKKNMEAERLEETKRHNRAIEEKGTGGGRGGATALMKNTEFLASLGYTRKEAADLLSSSKPMSRETFIGQATLRVMNNTFIPEDQKPSAIKQAIEIFDSSVKKGNAPTNSKVLTSGVNYLKGAKTREDAIKRIRDMAAKGWSKEDIAAAAKEAKWE